MSFGSPFGGFGQQQNQSSGFGFGSNTNNTTAASGGFGSAGTGGFGAKPAFGASTSAGGSLFGSTTTTAGATGFSSGGAFGSTNAAASTPFGGGSTSLFGANKPAFGSTGTTSTGLFGGNSNTTNTGFGGTSGGFGATANPGIGTNVGDPPGTAAVAFQPFVEKESTTNQQNSFQNILFMDAYKKWSAEELRLADYNQGRRYGNSTGTGAFGVGSNFGGFGSNSNTTNTSTTTTGGGLFGSSNNAFGQNTSTTGGFGSNTTTGNSLFGAKPATSGGLFGTNTATQQPAQSTGLFGSGGGGGFGSNTAGGFGSTANTSTTGTGLFGNTANQAKPAGGFGFGSNTQATTGFGSTGTTGTFGSTPAATNTSTGLFGTGTNTTSTTSGGLFGTNTQAGAATSGFGTGTTAGFGAQANQAGGLFGQNKPATGGLFGATNTATTGTTGGGLFGTTNTSSPFGAANNTQSSFLQKPAAATGGLFGASTAQPAASGGLFGNLGQNNQAQQQTQQSSPFGGSLLQNQQKPSLFGAVPAATNSLFGNQTANQQQPTNAFGQSTAATQQQGGMLGNSLFGNSQAAGLGASQGLTTSISDAGAYGAPSLFQSLTSAEVHNPGPLATPLSANKSKTSRRSSILPLYKMNPGSASKFATPQKRGYGFSYSTFGTPNSGGSMSSTPGSLSQSLFAGSVGRGMNKSISSSNLRRTYNADDSILLPGAFSSSSSTRFYGSTSNSKKLVINRDMRSDLFSTPTKIKDTGSEASDSLVTGSARKLTKRVSFDTSAAKATTPERNGDDADLGYIRPQGRPPSNGGGKSASNGHGSATKPATPSTPTSEPEMTQVTGKELAIVHEEESSPSANRCVPDNYTINSKDLGEYWMSPSKEEIDRMNRIQRQQVSDFTVGRVNVGQVRFRVPVDLTKINLDSIPGGIVTLVIRSATVYPDVHTKPPVGQGLNVPAEIMLLHTCPRSGPDVSAIKMKKHIARLKSIPDTEFVSYDEKLAAWTFTVEHFTTYGFDEDDDETDAEATIMSTTSGNDNTVERAAPAAAVRRAADSDDEGFDMRRRKRAFVPGAFDDNNNMIDDDEEDDVNMQKPSFLSNGSAEKRSLAVLPVRPTEYDEDMELSQDGVAENENEASFSRQHQTAAELDNSSLEDSPPFPRLLPDVPETPAGVVRARMRAIKESNTPFKVQVADGDNWMEMLQKTVSPQKRDRAALRAQGEMGAVSQIDFKESKVDFSKSARASTAVRNRNVTDNRGFATSIDLMNSLFEKAKAPVVKAPEPITIAKGFMKWPYKRQTKATDEDETNMSSTERAYHESMKPAWGVDGTCIVADGQDLDDGTFELALKRIRLFAMTADPLEGMVDHKEVVDVELVNGIPSVSTRRMPPIKTFATFCEHANRRGTAHASSFEKLQGSYEQSVWELASVLFDPIDGLANVADEARVRKENLCRFWTQLVQDATTKALEQTQSLEEKAVIFLAGHKVPEACRALVDSKNFKAAALTSLIGTSNAFKKDMREQMEAWQKGDVLGEFGVPLRALYSLLAGNVAVCAGKKGAGVENHVDSIVLSERFGLDWKQAFGLRLWYGTASGEGIETAVAQFVENLEQGRVPQPRPWYMDRRDVSISWTDPQSALREDLLFGLLKVAGGLCRLEDVLAPENAQPSPFRFRLCWQINQALTATSNVAASAKLSSDKADTVTSAYAAEVLHSGSSNKLSDDAWIHGLWVLLHLSDPTSRVQAVQDVLGRHAGLLFRGEAPRLYERLVDDLKVPAAWVWQAAALYWRYEQKQPALEAECLLRASAFVEAHTIFVKELAPKAIVEHDYEEIAQMLGQLQPHRHQISDWPLGGEVYSRFLDLLTLQRGGTLETAEGGSGNNGNSGSGSGSGSNNSNSTPHVPRTRGRQQQEARQGAEQASLQLTGTVEALVSSLPSMYENAGERRPTEVAAITEMADVVAKETMALANKGRMDLSKISRLPLTEDRRLRYSTDLAFAYYREVMAAH